MQTFDVKIVRQAGINPLTKQPISYAEETMQIKAGSRREAYRFSAVKQTLAFMGAGREVYIDGTPELGQW